MERFTQQALQNPANCEGRLAGGSEEALQERANIVARNVTTIRSRGDDGDMAVFSVSPSVPWAERVSGGIAPLASRSAALTALRQEVEAIEGRSPRLTGEFGSKAGSAWSLGEPAIDDRIGGELEIGAVHEVKGIAACSGRPLPLASAHAAAAFLALALTVRRLRAEESDERRQGRRRHILWVAPAALAAEMGGPYGPGLRQLGLAGEALVIATPRTAADALWVMEQGLAAGCLAAVSGCLGEIGLTPARRLALAAAASATSCLLVTHPLAPPAAATATRWRVAPAPSRSGAVDTRAPGLARLTLTLERCRARPAAVGNLEMTMEWCDAAFRFRLATALSDRAALSRGPHADPEREVVRTGRGERPRAHAHGYR
jgi:hypothetical protein